MMMYKQICVLLIVCVIKIVNITAFVCEKTDNTVTDSGLSNEERLKDDLMCFYEKYFLPLKNQSEEMNITIDMDINKYWIGRNNPEILHIDSIITVSWIDIHLKWEPKEYGSINDITINSDKIWKPEIMPQEMELFSSKVSILESSECKVRSNGNVSCRVPSSHFGYCTSDLYYWPYEIHECVIQYMSWSHNGEIITHDMDENKTIHINDENDQWKIIRTHIESYFMKPEPNIFISEMYFYFDVQEHMHNSIHLFYITLFTLVSLTILSFWTYFDDTSRLVLILINILCHFYELESFQWHMASVGHTIPYLLAFHRDSLVLTFVQLIETIALKKIFESEKPIPYLITLFTNVLNYNIIKQILFIQDNMINDMENEIENENDLEYIKKSEQNKKRGILFFVDRLFFIFILIGYMVLIITLTTL